MNQQVTTPSDAGKKPSRKKRALIVGTVVALAAGVVGVGALDTLRTSIGDNKSTVQGSHVAMPNLVVSGTPFNLEALADGGVDGGKGQRWILSNTGDAAANWDGVFTVDGTVGADVAAATRISAIVEVDNIDEPGTSGIATVDLGTLASPISLKTAIQNWQASAQSIDVLTSEGPITTSSTRTVWKWDTIGPHDGTSVTIVPSFDKEAVAKISDSILEGESRTATASFDVTYMAD
ncbi:hypothetical protein ACFOYW_17515 [Gryllotalpicola reticulitermitis]|uniref:Alternate signal-mediated exported protein, RER_14450 family n=1 Tax=Gryllotalpicola reticulitermitis TaxID=1184153 RepID=A0ABV8QA81_9MICO